MNYLWLTLLTIFAIDWFCRILAYSKTGDPKYKHDYFCWKKGGDYNGCHVKSRTR